MASSRLSSRSNVSKTKTSTPPSSSPSICSRNAARAMPGCGSARPIARTRAARSNRRQDLAAGRLACLAGELGGPRLNRPASFSSPYSARRNRFAPNVFVSIGVGAGLDVLAVDRRDEVRPAQDELVQAGPLGHAAREEQRSHRAVEQHRPAAQPDPEAFALGQERRIPVRPRPKPPTGRRSVSAANMVAAIRWDRQPAWSGGQSEAARNPRACAGPEPAPESWRRC